MKKIERYLKFVLEQPIECAVLTFIVLVLAVSAVGGVLNLGIMPRTLSTAELKNLASSNEPCISTSLKNKINQSGYPATYADKLEFEAACESSRKRNANKELLRIQQQIVKG